MGTDQNGVTSPYGFFASSESDNSAVVAVRGTLTPVEWLEDLEALLVDAFPAGAKVEAGFLSIFNSLTIGGIPAGTALSGTPNLSVCGHSLGGPLATLMAASAKAQNLVGLASPKPGNLAFATWVDQQVENITLYANTPDVVPHVPLTLPPWEDFCHVGPLTPLDSSGKTKGLSAAHAIETYLALLTA